MRLKALTLLLALLAALPSLAQNVFSYTYEGQTILYNVIDEAAKTVEVGSNPSVSGNLILPELPMDGTTQYTLTEISDMAFAFCSGLTEVTIPNSVTSIGNYAFGGCSGLTSINVESLNSNFSSIDGVLFNKDASILLASPGGKTGDYVIPNSVTEIGRGAFVMCSGLTEVTIPNSVTSIGVEAFSSCSGLTKVTIPNSVTSIGGVAFAFCSGLMEVTISNSVTSIGESAFENCSGLTKVTIPNSVTEIGDRAFADCTGLTSVTIGNSVTTIGFEAFGSCSGLTSVKLGKSLKEFDYAFAECNSISEVEYLSTTPIEAPSYTFTKEVYDNATLYVPEGSINIFERTTPWYNFYKIVEKELVAVSSLSFKQSSYDVEVGATLDLTNEVVILPEDATDKTVTWTSSNEAVATVDADGKVTAVALGEAVITAKCGEVSATCTVTVVPTPAESITLNQSTAQLKVGESVALNATVLPENATDKTVTWTSSNTAVATVDADGKVTAVALGEAVITAKCGEVSATCTVTVIPTPAESITLNQSAASLKVGESVELSATVLPEDTTDKTVIWTSSNEAVATVDANGKVTAVALGEAVITAKCGEVSASCSVTVVPTPAESITLSQSAASLKVGESVELSATVLPEDATDKTVTWASSNEGVAKVDANGKVTAVAPGEAVITASCGSVSAKCEISVLPILVESITLTPDEWSGVAGDNIQLVATILPENATDKSLIWTSSDATIATVDNTGLVSILKEGSCVITATANDGSGIEARCVVTGLSGIEAVFADSDAKIDVYSIGGVLLRKDCDMARFRQLTPGAYILRQGNKVEKVVVK